MVNENEAPEICACAAPYPPVKLMTRYSGQPIACVRCNLNVPADRLVFSPDTQAAVRAWATVYEAIYTLWLDSGDYEAWAQAQLEDAGSAVNREGLRLTALLDEESPCYYWLHQDETMEPWVAATRCPRCGQPLADVADSLMAQRACEGCRIIMSSE